MVEEFLVMVEWLEISLRMNGRESHIYGQFLTFRLLFIVA